MNKTEARALAARLLKREFTPIPGFDCVNVPCQHKVKGQHGIHGEEWRYVVRNETHALSLVCFTTRFPPTVPAHVRSSSLRPVIGAGITMHEKKTRGGVECDIFGKCEPTETSLLMAGDFVDKHAIDDPKQNEAFWKALEASASRCAWRF